MSDLQTTINKRRVNLVNDIKQLARMKQENIHAIGLCYEFIKEVIYKAERDDKEVPKRTYKSIDHFTSSGISDKIFPQARIDKTASFISDEFATINKNNKELMKCLAISLPTSEPTPTPTPEPTSEPTPEPSEKDSGLKMFSYIYHQWFISLISALDDFFSQLLLLVLKAYPERLDEKKQNSIEIKFSDLGKLIAERKPLESLLLDRVNNINFVEEMDEQIKNIVKNTMHQTPLKYFICLEKSLNLPENFLRLEWLRYAEMCLRRNTGVHSGWLGKDSYNQGLKKVKEKDRGNQLNFADLTIEFTGFDAEYFWKAYELAKLIINEFESHCEAQFTVEISKDYVEDAH